MAQVVIIKVVTIYSDSDIVTRFGEQINEKITDILKEGNVVVDIKYFSSRWKNACHIIVGELLSDKAINDLCKA